MARADRLVDSTAGRVVGPAFGLASFVRRARVFHPHGRSGDPGPLERLREVSGAVAHRRLEFTLLAAPVRGRWTAVADVELTGPVPAVRGERVRYTPFHTAGGIEPVGAVNALRRRAYADSQAARPS